MVRRYNHLMTKFNKFFLQELTAALFKVVWLIKCFFSFEKCWLGNLMEEGLKRNISIVVVSLNCMTNCLLATSAVLFCLGLLVWSFSFYLVMLAFKTFIFLYVASVPARRAFSAFVRAASICTPPERGRLSTRERSRRRLIFLLLFSFLILFFIITSNSLQSWRNVKT